jgi:hypothetical protein
MKLNIFDRAVMLAAVMFLGIIAVRSLLKPEPAKAENQAAAAVYIEPGVFTITAPDKQRQFLGKIVVDLTNGNVWGFPTLAKVPYPIPADPSSLKPPVSTPIYLGKFDFSAMEERE